MEMKRFRKRRQCAGFVLRSSQISTARRLRWSVAVEGRWLWRIKTVPSSGSALKGTAHVMFVALRFAICQ